MNSFSKRPVRLWLTEGGWAHMHELAAAPGLLVRGKHQHADLIGPGGLCEIWANAHNIDITETCPGEHHGHLVA